jgi:signal peptidase I
MKIEVMREELEASLGAPITVTPIQKKEPNNWIWYSLIGALFAGVIGFNLLFSLIRVSGHSMDNTLRDGQYVVVSKHRDVKRFDIVVLKERVSEGGDTKQVIKRVIGLPGDSIVVENGKLYINNQLYDEPYLVESMVENYNSQSYAIIVPEDTVFVLGDNRDVSKDSRMVGSFKKSAIIGAMETPYSEKGEQE